jgi:hypothetical protein
LQPCFGLNIPGHMLSAAIAYQILQQEPPEYREGKSTAEISTLDLGYIL